jgi:hypothetical protein
LTRIGRTCAFLALFVQPKPDSCFVPFWRTANPGHMAHGNGREKAQEAQPRKLSGLASFALFRGRFFFLLSS